MNETDNATPVPLDTGTLAEREARVNAELPGWQAWAIMTITKATYWNARPEGAPAAVITEKTDPAKLITAVRQYERDIARHLQETRGRLAACAMSNIGRDEAAQLHVLVTALENLSARLTATPGGAS